MTIPWSTLLPTRDTACACRRESIAPEDGGGHRYRVTFADGSRSEIDVVTADDGGGGGGDSAVVITEEWAPAPSIRSVGTLRRYATRYAPVVVDFCKSQVGVVVGDGTPRTLVDAALRAANARPAVLFNFGQAINEVEATEGDLMTFEGCVFRGAGEKVSRSRGAGTPHAAVVVSREGRVFQVWEAGVDGAPNVVDSVYNMMDLRDGMVTCYRALPPFTTIKPKHRK
jgi:hypothetical protein